MSEQPLVNSRPALSNCWGLKNDTKKQSIAGVSIVAGALIAAIITGGIGYRLIGGCLACVGTGLLITGIAAQRVQRYISQRKKPNYDFSKVVKLEPETLKDERIARKEILSATKIEENNLPKNFFVVIEVKGTFYMFYETEIQEETRKGARRVAILLLAPTNKPNEAVSVLEGFLAAKNKSEGVYLEDLLGFSKSKITKTQDQQQAPLQILLI
jgi:hypothetical protein